MGSLRTSGPPVRLFSPAGLPAIFLTLFTFAGIYKSSPYLAMPGWFDWTAAMGCLTVLSFSLLALVARKRHNLRFSPTDIWLALFSLHVLVGLLYSREASVGLAHVVEFLPLGVLACYFVPRILALYTPARQLVRNVQRMVVAIAVITSTLTVAGLATGERAFAGSYLSWGYFLGAAVILTVGLRQKATRWMKVAYSLAAPLLLAALVMTQARGPVIGLAVILLVVLFSRTLLPKKTRLWIGGAVLAAVTAVLVLFPSDTFYRFSLLFQQDKGASVNVRLDAWVVAWRVFLQNAAVGAGTGSFRSAYQDFAPAQAIRYPHNLFLGIAAENGAIGVALIAGFFLSLLSLWNKMRRRQISQDDRLLLASCLLVVGFFLVGALFSGHLPGRDLLLFAGLAVTLWQELQQTDVPSGELLQA